MDRNATCKGTVGELVSLAALQREQQPRKLLKSSVVPWENQLSTTAMLGSAKSFRKTAAEEELSVLLPPNPSNPRSLGI